jgi:hypothetical protein
MVDGLLDGLAGRLNENGGRKLLKVAALAYQTLFRAYIHYTKLP